MCDLSSLRTWVTRASFCLYSWGRETREAAWLSTAWLCQGRAPRGGGKVLQTLPPAPKSTALAPGFGILPCRQELWKTPAGSRGRQSS